MDQSYGANVHGRVKANPNDDDDGVRIWAGNQATFEEFVKACLMKKPVCNKIEQAKASGKTIPVWTSREQLLTGRPICAFSAGCLFRRNQD